MERADANSQLDLQHAAARLVLGLFHSWDIPPIADQALSRGTYSDSLAELAATTNPAMSDVLPLLQRAFAELSLPWPSKVEAALQLARHCVQRIASDQERPLDVLFLLQRVDWAAADVFSDKGHVGKGLDVGLLVGIYWSYDEPNENWYMPEGFKFPSEGDRLAVLDARVRSEARAWLRRHAPA